MLPLQIPSRLNVLCLGAHPDDIEIGCGGSLLSWVEQGCSINACWFVAAAHGPRIQEQQASADRYFAKFESGRLFMHEFPDTRFPTCFQELQTALIQVSREFTPDLVLTHRLEDRHQDHRQLAELTWNVWRDSLILEYEIPKWEGDLGHPQAYVTLTESAVTQKIEWLEECHRSQLAKDWFDAEMFKGLMRVRGAECRSPSRWAEAFHMRKFTVQPQVTRI